MFAPESGKSSCNLWWGTQLQSSDHPTLTHPRIRPSHRALRLRLMGAVKQEEAWCPDQRPDPGHGTSGGATCRALPGPPLEDPRWPGHGFVVPCWGSCMVNESGCGQCPISEGTTHHSAELGPKTNKTRQPRGKRTAASLISDWPTPSPPASPTLTASLEQGCPPLTSTHQASPQPPPWTQL